VRGGGGKGCGGRRDSSTCRNLPLNLTPMSCRPTRPRQLGARRRRQRRWRRQRWRWTSPKPSRRCCMSRIWPGRQVWRMMTVVTSCNVTPCVGIGALSLALCSNQLLCCSACSPAWPLPAACPFFVRWTHALRASCAARLMRCANYLIAQAFEGFAAAAHSLRLTHLLAADDASLRRHFDKAASSAGGTCRSAKVRSSAFEQIKIRTRLLRPLAVMRCTIRGRRTNRKQQMQRCAPSAPALAATASAGSTALSTATT